MIISKSSEDLAELFYDDRSDERAGQQCGGDCCQNPDKVEFHCCCLLTLMGVISIFIPNDVCVGGFRFLVSGDMATRALRHFSRSLMALLTV